MGKRHPRIANVDELDEMTNEKGRFGSRIRGLGRATGSVDLGCNYFEVEPGRTAFPFHYHCGIEEAIFVISGTGTLRIGDDEVAVRAGDYMSFPVGPDHAHQLLNDGEETLKYLCLSNRAKADVCGYPDSGKLAAMAANDPARWFETMTVRAIFKEETAVGYYDGEDTSES